MASERKSYPSPASGSQLKSSVTSRSRTRDKRKLQRRRLRRWPCRRGLLTAYSPTLPTLPNVSVRRTHRTSNYVWLRQALREEFTEFAPPTTRSSAELTGKRGTLGQGDRNTSRKACRRSLATTRQHSSPMPPSCFTYHHNDPAAYVAVVVAILDAGLDCTATLPAAAEMGASLHILGTKSSVLDSIFVCRRTKAFQQARSDVREGLERDAELMAAAGVKVSPGDIRCLASGHIARGRHQRTS